MNEWLLGRGGPNVVIFIVSFLIWLRLCSWRLVNSEMEAFSLTFNNSGNSLSKLTTNDIFEILSLSWFQNYPWMLDLVKKWLRYWWLKRRLQFPNRPSLSIQVAAARAPRGEVYLGWASLPRHSATEFLLVGPMHKRRETYQNRRASPLCFGNFFLSGKVLYQCAL